MYMNCLTTCGGSGSGQLQAEQKKSQFCGLNSQMDFMRNSMLVLPRWAEMFLCPRSETGCDALRCANGCG